MEKFEDEAASCTYAVVLATADDNAGGASSGWVETRARQNVIFELGWFYGRLGRRRVVLIKEPEVTLPGDILGTVYTSTEDWKMALAKELKAANIDVNLDQVY